jgi:hypothetical protein
MRYCVRAAVNSKQRQKHNNNFFDKLIKIFTATKEKPNSVDDVHLNLTSGMEINKLNKEIIYGRAANINPFGSGDEMLRRDFFVFGSSKIHLLHQGDFEIRNLAIFRV